MRGLNLLPHKAATRLLGQGYRPPHPDRQGSPRRFTPDVKANLLDVGKALGSIGCERLGGGEKQG